MGLSPPGKPSLKLRPDNFSLFAPGSSDFPSHDSSGPFFGPQSHSRPRERFCAPARRRNAEF